MIRSMTGYCSLRETLEDGHIILEIKALNHKGFDVHFHASRALAMLEIPTRECIQQFIRRGRIEIYLRGDGILSPEELIHPNPENAQKYMDAAKTISNALLLPFEPKTEFFLTLSGVLDVEEADLPIEETWSRLEDIFKRAMERLIQMKQSEGNRLNKELEKLLVRLDELNLEMKDLRNTIIEEYREKLLERISEWEKAIELDPNRVAQEVAFYVDRSDIQEEIVRLKSHITHFHEILDENTIERPYKAIGRRLDFLCQEMFREINTMGSKSSSTDLVKIVLEMKGTVDQLREQVQNVE